MKITGYEKIEAENWFTAVYSNGSKSAAFTDKGEIGKKMYAQMVASGETPAEHVTPIPVPLTWEEGRKRDYPPIPEQLDYIYHNGIELWKVNMIKPVKNKWPKT